MNNKPLFSSSVLCRLALAVAMGAGLAACAPGLGKMPEMRPIGSYFSAKSLQAEPVEWPKDAWWQVYGDPQLNMLVDKALADGPDMAIATARMKQAQAQAQQQGAVAFPQLNAGGNVMSARQSYNNGVPAAFVPQGWNDTGIAHLDFTYELDFWGKNRAALAAARGDAQAADADAAQARLMLVASVVSAYADLTQQVAEHAEAVSDTNVRTSTAKLITSRRKNGLENMGNQKQAEAQQATAEAELAALEDTIHHTRHRIAALVGEGPDFGLTLASPTVNIDRPMGVPTNLAADLLGRRPDVVAAKLRAEAAAKRIKVAKDGYYPNIDLVGTIGRQAFGVNLLDNPTSTYGNYGPAISLPIFTGGKIEGAYRGARGEYDEAVATYNQTVARALQDVADVVSSQNALVVRQQKTNAAVDAAQQAYNIANNRYRGGLAPYLDVLEAEDRLITARRAATTLQAQTLNLDVSLVRALGGGYGVTSTTPVSNTTLIENVKE